MVAIAALLCASCEIYPGGYSSFTYTTNGYSSSVAWTAASYDANGFPIYGYAYGRPVYAYTVQGSPIYSINLLYSGCYVPSWKPAPWCTHHHHYPSGCHHAPKPPRHEHGHKPHVRPDMHALIHKNPQSVLGKPRASSKPAHHATRPSHDSRPALTRPKGPDSHSTSTRPAVSTPRPGKADSHSTSTRPAVSTPRPSRTDSHSTSARPATSTKSSGSFRSNRARRGSN